MTRQHIVFLTGAGISAESGLSTFRGKMDCGLKKSSSTLQAQIVFIMNQRSVWTSIICEGRNSLR